MALHLSSITHQPWSQPTPTIDPTRLTRLTTRVGFSLGSSNKGGSVSIISERKVMRVKCAGLEVSVAEVDKLVGKVTEVNKDSFWPIVHSAQDKTLVLDMYTQWCGPCKVIAPKYQQLAQENLDVIFLKLDCNQENKALAKELGIRVVPTFKILRDGKVMKEVTGAKIDELVKAMNDVRSSS